MEKKRIEFSTFFRISSGPACPETCNLVAVRSQTMVLTTGVNDTIRLEPRDKFGNLVSSSELEELSARFSVSVVR